MKYLTVASAVNSVIHGSLVIAVIQECWRVSVFSRFPIRRCGRFAMFAAPFQALASLVLIQPSSLLFFWYVGNAIGCFWGIFGGADRQFSGTKASAGVSKSRSILLSVLAISVCLVRWALSSAAGIEPTLPCWIF